MALFYSEYLLAEHWIKANDLLQHQPSRLFRISRNCDEFTMYYNKIQGTLKSIAGLDEFLSGTYITCISFSSK